MNDKLPSRPSFSSVGEEKTVMATGAEVDP